MILRPRPPFKLLSAITGLTLVMATWATARAAEADAHHAAAPAAEEHAPAKTEHAPTPDAHALAKEEPAAAKPEPTLQFSLPKLEADAAHPAEPVAANPSEHAAPSEPAVTKAPEHAVEAAAHPAAVAAPSPQSHAAAKPEKHAAKEDAHAAKSSEHPAKAASHGAVGQTTKAEKTAALQETIDSLLKLGNSLTDRGDYTAAEIAFRQVLDGDHSPEKDVKTSLLGLAAMYRKKADYTKSVAVYERYLKEYSGDDRTPDALLALGRTLRDVGAYNMAINRFYSVINSTLKPAPESLDRYQVLAKTAQFEIAETFFKAGDFAAAAKYYNKFRLLDLAPADRARAFFKSGVAQRLQGNLDGATLTLRDFISQYPDDENIPEARYLLAISLRDLKRPQEALTATMELLQMEKARMADRPKQWVYWQTRTGNQLANDFFESGNTINALAIYNALYGIQSDPSWKLPLTYQIALCYERLGTTDRARKAYRSIIDAAGDKPSTEFAEIVRMSGWRIEHIDWREKTSGEINKIFESTSGKQAFSLPAETAAPNVIATP